MTRDPYRRYQQQQRRYNRQARRAWKRGGGYPYMLPGPYRPAAPLIMAALSRFLYRHRSAFRPPLITGAAFITAAALHRHHSATWPLILAAAALGAFIAGIPHRLMWPGVMPGRMARAGWLTRAWEACGITRTGERVYVTAIIAVTGLWLAAATAAGPARRPLPAIAVTATVILGIPWWAHRRRRARVRIEKTLAAWPTIADGMGLPGSRITSAKGDEWGFTARIILRKGTPAVQAVNRIPEIESGLGARPGSVRVTPDPHRADAVIARVMERDPHADPVPWPGQPPTAITEPAGIGVFEDGRPVLLSLLRRNVLIGGTTGAGKSGLLNVIIAYLAACGDAELWGIDLKGGMELYPWAGVFRRLATTPEAAAGLLADAVSEVDRRAALMADAGQRTWQPAPGRPARIVIADEYAELPPEALDYADSAARRGRAVAVSLIAATQRPTQDAMGGNAVRSQMDVRICLRVRERRDADLVLGQGAHQAGWRPETLAAPGTFLVSAPEHAVPDRARAYLITDAQVAAHAARHAGPVPIGPPAPPGGPQGARDAPGRVPGLPGPSGALRDALRDAPPEGVPVAALMAATGKGRTWVYARLRELADAGRAEQAAAGAWRAARPPRGDAR